MSKKSVQMMLALAAMSALSKGMYVPCGNSGRNYKESPVYIPKRQKIKGYKRGKK